MFAFELICGVGCYFFFVFFFGCCCILYRYIQCPLPNSVESFCICFVICKSFCVDLLSFSLQLVTLAFQSQVCFIISKAKPEGHWISFKPDLVHLKYTKNWENFMGILTGPTKRTRIPNASTRKSSPIYFLCKFYKSLNNFSVSAHFCILIFLSVENFGLRRNGSGGFGGWAVCRIL